MEDFQRPYEFGKLPAYLKGWKFCPQCTSELEVHSEEGCEFVSCPACTFIHYDNPFPTVTVTILHPDGQRVLLGQRERDPKKGTWCLPGGFMSGGEGSVETGVRELLEETCLVADPESCEIVGAWPGLYNKDLEMTTINLHYLVRLKVLDQTPQAGSDLLDVRWANLDDLDEMPFSNQTHALNKIRQMLAQ